MKRVLDQAETDPVMAAAVKCLRDIRQYVLSMHDTTSRLKYSATLNNLAGILSPVLTLTLLADDHYVDPENGNGLPYAVDFYDRERINKKRFILPHWSPVVGIVDKQHVMRIVISLIEAAKGRENSGMGTAAIITLQQALADNLHGVGRLEAHMCYFPTYFVTDALYGWTVRINSPRDVANYAASIAAIPPKFIYPKWLHTRVEGDLAATRAREKENAEAIYYGVDLCWASPAIWHEARVHEATHSYETVDTEGVELTYAHEKLLLEWQREFAAAAAATAIPGTRVNWPAIAREGLGLWALENVDVRQVPLRSLPVFRHFALEEALAALGNNDDASHGPLCIQVTTLGEIAPLEQWADAETRFVFRLMMAYLIDYGRVMYRPIVLQASLERRICQAADVQNITDLFDLTSSEDPGRLMPICAPYFVATGQDDSLVWIPTRKPRSTSSWAGTDRLPIPRREKPTALVLRSTAEEEGEDDTTSTSQPPRKRPRLECHFCSNGAPVFADAVHFFCNEECQRLYYNYQ